MRTRLDGASTIRIEIMQLQFCVRSDACVLCNRHPVAVRVDRGRGRATAKCPLGISCRAPTAQVCGLIKGVDDG